MKRCILDWETLGVRQDSIVLSVGVLVYDEEETHTWESLKDKGLYIKFNIEEQKKMGRIVQKSTIDWWKNQAKNNKEALKVLKPDARHDTSLKELPKLLNRYFEQEGYNGYKNKLYTRGQFDYLILQSIYEDNLKEKLPIPFWNVRDIRTLIDTLTFGERGKVPGFEVHPETVLHHALDDCKNDLLQIQAAWQFGQDDEE